MCIVRVFGILKTNSFPGPSVHGEEYCLIQDGALIPGDGQHGLKT